MNTTEEGKWDGKREYYKMWIADLGDGPYRNPILYTDYFDPDVVRVGEDYFRKNYQAVREITEAKAGIWVGVKAGLIAIHEGKTECRAARISYFVFQTLNK